MSYQSKLAYHKETIKMQLYFVYEFMSFSATIDLHELYAFRTMGIYCTILNRIIEMLFKCLIICVLTSI